MFIKMCAYFYNAAKKLVILFTQQILMIPLVLSVIARASVYGQNCFGGVETFEKIAVTDFDGSVQSLGLLLQQENVALTRDCINLCKQHPKCQSFALDYSKFRCESYATTTKTSGEKLVHAVSTNFFEKICINGVSRSAFDTACGNHRLWSFERVNSAYIDGFVEKQLNNIGSKEECAKTCLIEASFICRSADYDHVKRICRMSKEDRRTQPQAFRQIQLSSRHYLENQCASSGPSSCVYRTKSDLSVLSMDSLQFATSSDDCQMQCDRESSFNCRSFSYISNRCFLSGDDGVSLTATSLPTQKGSVFAERTCVAELCTNGIFTYEKMTGHVLRSAVTTAVELPNIGELGATGFCRESCDSANLNCPAFSVNYQSSRCEKLDRNSQGRTGDLIARDGESYFEKICLRVPQIMSMCQDKYWAFERVLGHELAPVFYTKTLNFVQSRRDCEEYCLQERQFACRSALYNDETTECKLSEDDRRTQPGSYYRSRSSKINYLENQCVRSHSTCPYERTLDAYPTYTDVVESNGVSSHEVCEKYCNDNKRFLCRSYAFYSSNGQCFISGDDRASAGSSAVQKRSGIEYYERQCPKLSTSRTTTTSTPSGDTQSVSPTAATKPSTDNASSVGSSVAAITKFPASLIPTLPPKFATGNSLDAFAHQSPPMPPPMPPLMPPPIAQTMPPPIPPSLPFAPPLAHMPLSPTPAPAPTPTPTQSRSQSPSRSHPRSRPTLEVPRALETDLHNVHISSSSKCGPHSRYLFEKVTSFEPIGGFLTPLYSDLQNAGIVTECARRCEHSSHCRAFIVDYYHQTCDGLFENSSVGNLDLRLSMGKDYFEGFCVPNHIECNKLWPFDRIVDQASIGVKPEHSIKFISRGECRKRCLEERTYKCVSASYDSALHECRLYAHHRNSGELTLLFTKGTDYMENQCAIETGSCRYHPIERDISIVTVTKSVRGTSTFHCEQACDHEKEFNCRSYTYLDNPDGSNAAGGNLCLLSSDNRATSHQGSMQFRPRALYAEKDCVFNADIHRNRVPVSQQTPLSQSPHAHTHTRPQAIGPTFAPPLLPMLPLPPLPPMTAMPQSSQFAPQAQSTNSIQHENIAHIPVHCSPKQYTYEKTFGYDLRYARRERAPFPPRLAIIIQCHEECLRRGDRCRAIIIEYGLLQSCFLLDELAGEHSNQLTKSNNLAYLEKICLRERTCGKLWTFERVIAHTLQESADKEIPNVLLRTDCQDLCLSEKSFVCRSVTYHYTQRLCKLYSETRRSRPNSFQSTNEFIDYFENQCVNEPSTCQYRDTSQSFFPYIDRITNAFSLTDCQRQCDTERLFPCRAVNFETFSRDCALCSEDMVTLSMVPSALTARRNSIYSEKGNCEQVSVQCNQQDMVLTLNFDSPFNGRVYAKGSPSQCFVAGTGQTQLQFAISLGSRCGTRQEGANNFANEVVVQQHAVIMTDSDRTIRVLCSFDTGDQTVTLTNTNLGKPGGIDVTSLMNARTRLENAITSVVTNTAPPPAVVMRILDRSGQDAQIVGLGDELVLRIELKQPSSAFAIFARNLYARSSSGESLFLIDNTGCPADPAIFPALQVDARDKRSLHSTFKAFRFPSTGVVNFEVQIRFCQDKCEPIKCMSGSQSYGKRRKRSSVHIKDAVSNERLGLSRDPTLEPIVIANDETIMTIGKRIKTRSTTPDDYHKPISESTTKIIQIIRANKNRSALMEERYNVTTNLLNDSFKQQPLKASDKPFLDSNTQSLRIARNQQIQSPSQSMHNHFGQTYSYDSSNNKNYHKYGFSYGLNPRQNYYHSSSYKSMPSLPLHSQWHSLPLPPQSTTHLPIYLNGHNSYNGHNGHNGYNSHYIQTDSGHYSPLNIWHSIKENNNGWHSLNEQQTQNNGPDSITGFSLPQIKSDNDKYIEQVSLNMKTSRPPQPSSQPSPHPSALPSPQPSPQRLAQPLAHSGAERSPLPASYLEWGNARPSRPLPPPRASQNTKIVASIASTERPEPQEVPLSLAIMVGEHRDNMATNWKQNTSTSTLTPSSSNHINLQTHYGPTEECASDSDCNIGIAVFYTSLIVSFIHIGLIAGGYFYISKFRSLRSKFSTSVFDSQEDIRSINHQNGRNGRTQTINDNVFYGNRELYFGSFPNSNASNSSLD